jgi:hypothetical protein
MRVKKRRGGGSILKESKRKVGVNNNMEQNEALSVWDMQSEGYLSLQVTRIIYKIRVETCTPAEYIL